MAFPARGYLVEVRQPGCSDGHGSMLFHHAWLVVQ
jgi:hypothetical protein